MERHTDTHSQGLALDFYNSYTDIVNKAFDKEIEFRKKLNNSSNIKKYLDFNKSLFQKYAIFYTFLGSKKNPYIIFHYPWTITTKKEMFGWEERGFNLHCIYMPVKNKNNSFQNFSIEYRCTLSIHAIAQLIFRLKIKKSIFEKDYSILLNQLKYVHITSAFYEFLFWRLLENDYFSQDQIEQITIPIPSNNGFFLAHMRFFGTRKIPVTSIRTFISDEELDEDQKILKEKLINIFNLHNETIEYSLIVDFIKSPEAAEKYLAFFYFYYLKIMEFIDDFLYVLSYKGQKHNAENYFRFIKIFEELKVKIIDKVKISSNDLIDEIHKKVMQDPIFI